jgi:molybdopterin-guanine dinucleotide biosynthesis protein A
MGKLEESKRILIKDVAGAVLAGGKSRRFGSDKRFFKLNDKTLLEIMCEKLRSVFETKYISTEKNFEAKLSQHKIEISDFKIVHDKYDDIGPISGIVSVLYEISQIGCVFVPCDMPFLPEKILFFLPEFKDFDIVYFNLNGKIYPIPGYYSKNLISEMEKIISKGIFALKYLIQSYRGKKLELGEKEVGDLGVKIEYMKNINEPQNLQRF